ncbi:MAG: hypothetical protein V1820_05530 [archaeon]
MITTRTPKAYFGEGELQNMEVLTIQPGMNAVTGYPDEPPALIAAEAYREFERLVGAAGKLKLTERIEVVRITPILKEMEDVFGTVRKYASAVSAFFPPEKYGVTLATTGWEDKTGAPDEGTFVAIDVYVSPMVQ